RIRGATGVRCMRGRIAGAILIGAVVSRRQVPQTFRPASTSMATIYSPVVARIEPVIVFDYEPGVIVRTYWLPPGEIVIIFRARGSGKKLVAARSCPSTACQSRKNIFAGRHHRFLTLRAGTLCRRRPTPSSNSVAFRLG